MKKLKGRIFKGSGNNTRYITKVLHQIEEISGLPLRPGSVNLRLREHYPILNPVGVVPSEEYEGPIGPESIKIARCRIELPGYEGENHKTIRGVIIRPSGHEYSENLPKYHLRIEIMCRPGLMARYDLKSGVDFEDESGSVISVEVEGDEAWWMAPEAEV